MHSEPSVLRPDVSCCLPKCRGWEGRERSYTTLSHLHSNPPSAYAKQEVGSGECPQKRKGKTWINRHRKMNQPCQQQLHFTGMCIIA